MLKLINLRLRVIWRVQEGGSLPSTSRRSIRLRDSVLTKWIPSGHPPRGTMPHNFDLKTTKFIDRFGVSLAVALCVIVLALSLFGSMYVG